ncbi:hypothetical protein [Nocardia anaemiae]|uniref:hypothetical protein n=1 Tax=Nocardia anaemiae TaxID=263910 RepID=UPI0007A54C7E|nr:hypothetical protein [Nocardia anaemiae]
MSQHYPNGWKRARDAWKASHAPIYEAVFLEIVERNTCHCDSRAVAVDYDDPYVKTLGIDICRTCAGITHFRVRCTGSCKPDHTSDGSASMICQKCQFFTCIQCSGPVTSMLEFCDGCTESFGYEVDEPPVDAYLDEDGKLRYCDDDEADELRLAGTASGPSLSDPPPC